MKSCDPRTKLLAILLLTSLAIIFRNPLWMFGLAFASLFFALVMGTDFAAFLKRFRHFITLLIGVAFVQVIFVRTGAPMLSVGDFTLVYSDGHRYPLFCYFMRSLDYGGRKPPPCNPKPAANEGALCLCLYDVDCLSLFAAFCDGLYRSHYGFAAARH